MKVATTLIITFFVAIICTASETKRSLRIEYNNSVNSLFGGSIVLSCGGSIFKIESGFFTGPLIYWKDGLIWKKIDNSIFFDEGVELHGLLLKGSVPFEFIEFEPDLPIFKKTVNFIEDRNPRSYFSVKDTEEYYPYIISIDFIEETINYKNSVPILNSIEFDSQKYIEEQLGNKPDTTESKFFNNKNALIESQKKKAIIDRHVNEYTEKYLLIEVQPYAYNFSKHCNIQ